MEEDRRRLPRFSCGGQAKIICLPSNGIFLPGQVRDLSLGGCRIETVSPLDCGTEAEILVHVNAASFRALGRVKAVRGRAGICVEFMRLSAGGRKLLEALVRDLAKAQAERSALKNARVEVDSEEFRERLRGRGLEKLSLREQYPVFGAVLPPEQEEERAHAAGNGSKLVIPGVGRVVDAELEEDKDPLDFFI